ncbi:MAG: hypothetical protein LBU85_11245, partial [Treponema sp.]|nr:hypothetical protein [Treponema sp.]
MQRRTALTRNRGADFTYVDRIGYNEYGQRTYVKLGNGTETRYTYDEQRRWLSEIKTVRGNTVLQNITYSFDPVGNVLGYANDAGSYHTEQDYSYDALYQLTGVNGESKSYQYGLQEYAAYYSDHLGSAQLITDYKGDEYERLEYTPYG